KSVTQSPYFYLESVRPSAPTILPPLPFLICREPFHVFLSGGSLPKGAVRSRTDRGRIRLNGAGRQDMGVSAAPVAADAQLSPHRTRTAGTRRRRHAGHHGNPGQAARGVPQGRIEPEPHPIAVALLLHAAGAVSFRRCANAHQLRPASTRLAHANLGMD